MVQGLGLRAWGLGNCIRISDRILYEGFCGADFEKLPDM